MNRSDTFRTAILRTPGPDCGDGLTTSNLGRPDYARLLKQHEAYARALAGAGTRIPGRLFRRGSRRRHAQRGRHRPARGALPPRRGEDPGAGPGPL
jgi:hypothetical protein